MMDFREGNKIIVPEEQMRRFIAVTGTYDEQLMFFKPEELNLSKGTKVRVRGGDFEGRGRNLSESERCARQACGYRHSGRDCRCIGDHLSRFDRSHI